MSLLLICSDRVPSVFRARPARGSLFFACTKKSDQKKCAPGAAPFALRAAGAQGQAGVRSMGFLPIRELARIPARDPSGGSVLPSPRLTGPRIKSNGQSCFASAFRFCAQDARALALPGDPWPCGGSGRSGPKGAREGSRAFRCCTGCAISGTRPMTRTVRAGARTAQGAGVCFFAYLLCISKESRPLGRRTSGSLCS